MGSQAMSASITPTSAANLIEIETQAMLSTTGGVRIGTALFQGTTFVTAAYAAVSVGDQRLFWRQVANSTSAVTFNLRFGTNSGTGYFNEDIGTLLTNMVPNSFIKLREIMGALEPANDNASEQRKVG